MPTYYSVDVDDYPLDIRVMYAQRGHLRVITGIQLQHNKLYEINDIKSI
jgi:hypothetical protein